MSHTTSLSRNPLPARVLCATSMVLITAGCHSLPIFLTENRDRIVGIEVALEPETGTSAQPVTLLRQFVRANDLVLVSSAIANVMSTTNLDALNVKSASGTPESVAPALRRLGERMVEATRLFELSPETAKEFISTPDHMPMSDAAIYAIENFVPGASGVNYRGGVTFRPTAAVYQLGANGAPQRKLWTWTGENGARHP